MPSLGHLGPPEGSTPRLRCQRWVKAWPPYVYPISKKTEGVGRLWDKWEERSYFPCPVTNPVERILADNKLSHSALAQRLSRYLTISPDRIRRLASGEAVMRPKVAEALGREFGVPRCFMWVARS